MAGDTLSLEPDGVIGIVDGDPDYLFGLITSVAADPAGRIYVADGIGADLRAYAPDGTFLGRVAREGGGPGEITGWVADVVATGDSRLYVRDATRITILAPRSPASLPDSVVATWPLPGYGNLASTRSRVGDDGRYFYPAYLAPVSGPARYFYLPFHDNGAAATDTVEVPAYGGLATRREAWFRTGPGGGRHVPGLNHVPFSPRPVWDLTPRGTILSADGTSPFLLETDAAGDTLRALRLPAQPARRIPPDERADSARALQARLESAPVPVGRIEGLGAGVAEGALPERYPEILSVHVAMDGRIWLERWPPPGQGESRSYDVLADDGTRLRTVVLRAPVLRDPPPFIGHGRLVGVLRDAGTGVDRVAHFHVPEF